MPPLSNDERMLEAYNSGDPYLEFAKQAGAVPNDATKQSHADVREQFKVCSLAVQYGMTAYGLAGRLGVAPIVAEQLLRLHQRTYRTFWEWIAAAVNFALIHGYLYTCYGWRFHLWGEPNERSLRNWPVQSTAAEMMRVAAIMLTEGGITVRAPVHDAFLIGGPASEIDAIVERTSKLMAEASKAVPGRIPARPLFFVHAMSDGATER